MSDTPSACYVTLYPDVPKGVRITDVLMNRVWGDVPLVGLATAWTTEHIGQMRSWADELTFAEMARRMGKGRGVTAWAFRKYCPDLEPAEPKLTWRDRWREGDLQRIKDEYILIRMHPARYFVAKFGVTNRQFRYAAKKLEYEMADE